MKRIYLLLLAALGASAAFAQNYDDRRVVPTISTAKNTEFAPTISADGRTIIFESDANQNKGWELFESHMDDRGIWSVPVPLTNINEKCSFLAGPSLSYDGNTLYFTAFIENTSTSEDIYFSERMKDNNWSEPKPIGAPINTNDTYEGFPSISSDGNSLYFVRTNESHKIDPKSKENCFVIYVSHREPDETWGEPIALPAPINTGCERDPKIMADSRTLIFSSIRDGRKGKYDLFQSQKQPDNTWSEPVPMEFVNSNESDQSPCISASGDRMYYYRLRDIYTVTIPKEFRQMVNITVRGTVKSDTGKPLKATILVHESGSMDSFENMSSAIDGEYLLVLLAGKKYVVEYFHNEHLMESIVVDFQNDRQYSEHIRNITLKSSYVLHLTIDDPERKSKVTAFFSAVSGDEKIQDSIQHDKYPHKVRLKAGKTYQFKATAPLFPEIDEEWVFDPKKFSSEMHHSIHLSHEKVSYTADVTNIISRQKSKVKVYFNNENVDEVIVAESGDVVLLRKGDRYQVMTASDKGFFYSSVAVVAGEGEKDQKGDFAIPMEVLPIEVGAQLTLKNITFASNSAQLKPSSRLELDRVIELMQKNPSLHIEISAHTDNKGSDTYNLKLSQSRATSVVNYLTKNGAPVSAMLAVGFGKRKPIFPNTNEKNREANRRVELHVLKFE